MAMDTEQRQRILGYFLEEAEEHLSTFEQGLLNFQETLRDPELINELFRAAHSIKGGAAMLELSPIQKIAHRLEENFKILKDNYRASFSADVSLLLTTIVAALSTLVNHVKQGKELSPAISEPILNQVRPLLETLEKKIAQSIHGEATVIEIAKPAPSSVQQNIPPEPPPSGSLSHRSTSINSEESALHLIFKSDIPVHLRQMLKFFKCADEQAVQEELIRVCDTLDRIGEQFELAEWCNLVGLIRIAIIDPTTSYPEIGAIVLRDLKQAQDKVLKNAWQDIHASSDLLTLLPAHPSHPVTLRDDNFLITDPPVPEESSTMMEDTLDFDTSPLGQILNELDQSDLQDLESSTFPDLEPNLDVDLDMDMDIDTEDMDSLTNLFGTQKTEPLAPVNGTFSPEDTFLQEIGDTSEEDMDNILTALDSLPAMEGDVDLDELFGDSGEGEAIGFEDLPEESAVSVYPIDEEITLALQNLEPTDQSSDESDLFGLDNTGEADAGEWNLLWEETAKPEASALTAEQSVDSVDSVDFGNLPAVELSDDFRLDDAVLEDSSLDDSGFDALGFDNSFDNSSFDNSFEEAIPNLEDSSLDDSGFDALGFDNSFDNSSFDNSSFDNSSFDNSFEEAIPSLEDSSFDDSGLGNLDLEDSGDMGLLGEEPESTLEDTRSYDTYDTPEDNFSLIEEDVAIDELALDSSSFGLLEEDTPPTLQSDQGFDEGVDFMATVEDLPSAESFSGFAEPPVEDLVLETVEPQVQASSGEELFDLENGSQGATSADQLQAQRPGGWGWESFFEEETQIGEYPLPSSGPEDLFDDSLTTPTVQGDITSASVSLDTDLDLGVETDRVGEEQDYFESDFSSDSSVETIASDDLGFESEDLGLESEGLELASDDLGFESEDLGLESEGLELASDNLSFESEDLGLESEGLELASEDLGLESEDLGLESEGLELASEDLGFESEDLGFESEDLELASEDLGFESEDLGFESEGLELASDDLGFESEDLGLESEGLELASDDLGFESEGLELGFESETSDTEAFLDFGTEEPIAESLPEMTAIPPAPQSQTGAEATEEDNEFDLELLGLDETFTGRISDSERAALTQELNELDLEVEAAFDPELLPGGEILDEGFDLDLDNDFYGETAGIASINIGSDASLGSSTEPETSVQSQDGEPDLGWGDFSDQDFGLPPTNELLQSEISEFETLSEDSLLRDDLFESLDPSGSTSLADEWGDLDSILEAPGLPQELDDFAQLDGLLDSSPSSETSLDSLDNLDALLDSPISSNGNGSSLELDDLDSLLDSPPPPAPPQEPDSGLGTLDEDLSDLMLQADMLGGPPVAAGLGQPGRRAAVTQQSMKVPVKQLDNLNNLVGEMVVNRNSLETDQERLRQSIDKLLYQVQQLGDVGQRLQDLYERSLLENALLASRQSVMQPSRSSHHHEESSHHDGFDALEMDRFSGFHLLSQEMIELIVRVRESASDIDYIVNEPLDYVARNFRQVTTQLQEGLTRARMVPFEQGMTRLPRAVREVTGRCGKQAKLILEGKETLVDKVLLEQLYNPMTHLVNNAVTHGIETPEERMKAGKPAEGKIQIQAFHQGNQTVIVVSDDGAGIDAERVRRKAIEKGLVSRAEATTLNELQLYDFLFHPGFSTKDKADDFSGRGVGMDVVRTNLQNMRGSINTDSVRGKGTTFTIRLPLTLSISKSLCCISNRARIAFPMDGVEDMLDVPEDRVQRNAQDQPCIQWRDQLIPFRPLSDLLRFNRQTTRSTVYGGTQDDDMLSIVILRTAGEYIALQVDRVEGEKEIVIKQLEGPIPKPTGIAGVTVMSDGQVMPIADVLELIDLAKGRSRQTPSMLWKQEPVMQEEAPHEPLVLIVDDSIVVRELLSMTFNKSGYRVEQARDGQEAWEKLRSGLPCDIVFCDIEMPRMTGLELLEKLQKDQTLKNLPIAMLTSRGADRHRQMATQLGARGYFTKPYLEEALLEAASRMLKGEVLVGAAV